MCSQPVSPGSGRAASCRQIPPCPQDRHASNRLRLPARYPAVPAEARPVAVRATSAVTNLSSRRINRVVMVPSQRKPFSFSISISSATSVPSSARAASYMPRSVVLCARSVFALSSLVLAIATFQTKPSGTGVKIMRRTRQPVLLVKKQAHPQRLVCRDAFKQLCGFSSVECAD